MKRRTIFRKSCLAMLACVLLVMAFPVIGRAEEHTSLLIVGGTLIADSKGLTGDMPAGVDFDLSTNTLTLNNYRGHSGTVTLDNGAYLVDYGAGITYSGTSGTSLTINLIGDNYIACDAKEGLDINAAELYINGPGSLTIEKTDEESQYNVFEGVRLDWDCNLFRIESAHLNIQTSKMLDEFYGIVKRSFFTGKTSAIEFLGCEVNIEGYVTDRGESVGIDSYNGDFTVTNSEVNIDLQGGRSNYYLKLGLYNDGNKKAYGGTLTIDNSDLRFNASQTEEGKYLYCYNVNDVSESFWYAGMRAPNKEMQRENVLNTDGKQYVCSYPCLTISKMTIDIVMAFDDVQEGAWYYNTVDYIFKSGLMTGLDDINFGPDDFLARAQFAAIMHRKEGSQLVEYTPVFPDVADGQWYTKPVLWANEAGVVKGYMNGYFGPGDLINREQMAVMMYRYAGIKGYDTSKEADLSAYVDADSVSSYSMRAVKWCVAEGIISGKDNGTRLDPQGNATRAECAAIIKRFVEKYTVPLE